MNMILLRRPFYALLPLLLSGAVQLSIPAYAGETDVAGKTDTAGETAGTEATDRAGAMGDPGMTVAIFHKKLLGVMQRAGELGYQGRYRELEPYISNCFDIALITDIILGRYRNRLDEAQKTEFNNLFSRFSAATYASRFDGYGGEEFLETSREATRRGRMLIRTELRRPGDDAVSLDYLLHEKQGKWYIISVSADGVNDLSLKRAEYAAVIKEKGYNGLLNEILFKIEQMETGN